ncbi:ASCH domain-containing protein [uncultured Maricaulis sp.]|uniref:ASCH domain-containing protein n=1 Tax=uncultured Maricaulis sp. TaxID=174710 RepID=UPI00262778B3|nr:ASCH domain-containing protein [uncultured Maricaulis sp.]
MTPVQAAYWQEFCDTTGHDRAPDDVFAFGDSEALADELLALVLIDRKKATASHARWHGPGKDPIPKPGDLALVLDGRNAPACIIQTTGVDIHPVRDTTEEFAWTEGEGDRSLAWWMAAHIDYWNREAEQEGYVFDVSQDAVFHRFNRVWPLPASALIP